MTQLVTKWLPNEALVIQQVSSESSNFIAEQRTLHIVSVGGITVTLPPASQAAYIVVKDSSGDLETNPISIQTSSAELIDGQASSFIMDSNYQSVTMYSDGIDWYII